MQNIVTPVISPTVSAHSPAVADSTVPTELFGNVLARQLADSVQLGETNAPDTGLPITSATDNILTLTPGNEQPIEPQVPTPDGISALPNDMLAALLPHNIAAQISISRTQPTQPEAVSHNQEQSITTSKVPLGYDAPAIAKESLKYDTPATALEILNSGHNSKSMTLLADSPLSTPATALEIANSVHSSKSMTLLADSQLSPQSSTQVSAPPPNATALAALPAQASSAENLSLPIQLSVDTPLAHNAWTDEFSQKITWVATQHGQSAELHLNPPQLGPLDVLIKVDGDQATALFTSPHAVVRDAIEQALPKLREMLADNGIMLGNASVSDQSSREQQAKQSDQQHKREGWQAKMDQAILVSSPQVRSGRHHQGLVDTFA
ncbi:MAG: flagellar hook-length control protein FliK [Candidatus Nitrotoga sp.]|nr:flagellar hook-length control protein FliK [Candidatus Nitrotoga sp.]